MNKRSLSLLASNFGTTAMRPSRGHAAVDNRDSNIVTELQPKCTSKQEHSEANLGFWMGEAKISGTSSVGNPNQLC